MHIKLNLRHLTTELEWVPVSLISKVSDSWIRDLRFNYCLSKNQLISLSDDKELSLVANTISWKSL